MGLNIRGGRAGSAERVKNIKDSSRAWIRYLKEGEDLTVRFLTEPDDWQWYWEHYSPEVNFFPCIGDECPGCTSDSEQTQRASRRFLANALDTNTGQVVPLKLPLDLANRLVARYERYGNTITDRDYTLHRMGKRLETTYDVTPEEKQPMDLSRYELADLEKVLVHQFRDAFGMDDEEEDAPSSPRSGPEPDTDDDTDDDVAGTPEDDVPSESSPVAEQDADDDEYLTEDEALKMSREELKALADEYGVTIKSNWKKSQIVDAIFSSVAE